MKDINNRMLAKCIPGEHCRFCGDPTIPLVKTPCCDQWICCDTEILSYRGGGFCQSEHENSSQCYFHNNEDHKDPSKSCKECQEFFRSEYVTAPRGSWSKPKYKELKDPAAAEIHRSMFNGS